MCLACRMLLSCRANIRKRCMRKYGNELLSYDAAQHSSAARAGVCCSTSSGAKIWLPPRCFPVRAATRGEVTAGRRSCFMALRPASCVHAVRRVRRFRASSGAVGDWRGQTSESRPKSELSCAHTLPSPSSPARGSPVNFNPPRFHGAWKVRWGA